MSANSKIEWTDHTFNPWLGCTKVSPACDHCYAERSTPSRTLKVAWGAGQPRHRTGKDNWRDPGRWNDLAEAFAAQHGRRQRVFCASLADVFDNEVPDEWRADLFDLIDSTPNLDWLLLTKRIGNVRDMLRRILRPDTMPANVWLGATICNQAEADRDIPKLLRVPARVRFLSIEPLLGPIELGLCDCDHGSIPAPYNAGGVTCPKCNGTGGHRVDWVIVGGESGPNARPMHPDWARSLRDQCQAAGVAFHFKQHGEWLATAFCDDDMAMLPSKKTVYVGRDGAFHDGSDGVDFFSGEEETAWVGKKAAGRLLDGREWNEVPT